MDVLKKDDGRVEQIAGQSEHREIEIRDLAELELALVGGGMGDVHF